MSASDISSMVLREALLDVMTEGVDAVMVVRYGARPSEETTEQARILANAALSALDDFGVEHRTGDDGGGSTSGECWPGTLYARLVGPWTVARPGGHLRASRTERTA